MNTNLNWKWRAMTKSWLWANKCMRHGVECELAFEKSPRASRHRFWPVITKFTILPTNYSGMEYALAFRWGGMTFVGSHIRMVWIEEKCARRVGGWKPPSWIFSAWFVFRHFMCWNVGKIIIILIQVQHRPSWWWHFAFANEKDG